MTASGSLFLIPVNLTEPIAAAAILPPTVLAKARELDAFIVENAKSARAFLKAIGVTRVIADIHIVELDKHATAISPDVLLAPLLAGRDMGLLSEAGAPAVADPGANVVAAAHQSGIKVVPCVGPSSILLALMASGLHGQKFAFHGYLPREKGARQRMIAELERESALRQMTQIFIETPYRNQALLDDLARSLKPRTRVCVATDLTGAEECVMTAPAAQFANQKSSTKPTVFLFLAEA